MSVFRDDFGGGRHACYAIGGCAGKHSFGVLNFFC